MIKVIQTIGWLRVLLGLFGASFFFKSFEASGMKLPPIMLVIQALLVATAIGGGVGWILLRDWGRKLLLVPSLYTVIQTVTVFFLGILPAGQNLLPLLLGVVVSGITLILIFLPAARCENPSWDDVTNSLVFRAVGGVQLSVGLCLGLFLVWISQSVEGLVISIFTAPTVILAVPGGLLMLLRKTAGRRIVMGLWLFHVVLAGAGPLLSRLFRFEVWEVALTGAMNIALRDQSTALPISNVVFLGTALLLVLAWLPSPLASSPRQS